MPGDGLGGKSMAAGEVRFLAARSNLKGDIMFKVGDKVEYVHTGQIGEVICFENGAMFPVQVMWKDDRCDWYTENGEYRLGGPTMIRPVPEEWRATYGTTQEPAFKPVLEELGFKQCSQQPALTWIGDGELSAEPAITSTPEEPPTVFLNGEQLEFSHVDGQGLHYKKPEKSQEEDCYGGDLFSSTPWRLGTGWQIREEEDCYPAMNFFAAEIPNR